MKEKLIKLPQDSLIIMNELVLPHHTNVLNNLMGGHLMHWMDIVSALSAQKHAQRAVVTASVDNVSFKLPIRLGNLVRLEAQVTRSFNTSMEVFIQVTAENLLTGESFISNTAFFTFVALDQSHRPTTVSEIKPNTPEEKQRYDQAKQRRMLRLLLDKTPERVINDHLKALQ